jgi:hypothetical protein
MFHHRRRLQTISAPRLEPVDPFIGATITVDGQSFVLGGCMFRQYALTGQGTYVIDANGGAVVVSWPDTARTPENEFLGKACRCTEDYSNDVYSSMTAHLPKFLASEDFDTTSGPGSRVRRALPQEPEPSQEASRVFRVTVYARLQPMADIRTADDFKQVMWDIARCK